ncbi:23S RNA-specific pseudouridylate synthase, partial [Acinetobacter baumannii ABNIH7]
FKNATLVHASPLSGRTHQIRVHGLSIGHPLVGDDKYGHNTAYTGPEARRLCLHAMRLDNLAHFIFVTALNAAKQVRSKVLWEIRTLQTGVF